MNTPNQNLQHIHQFLEDHDGELQAELVEAFVRDIPSYSSIPQEIIQKQVQGILRLFRENWLSQTPDVIKDKIVKGLIAGIDAGFTFRDVLHMVALFRQSIHRVLLRIWEEHVPGAAEAYLFLDTVSDKAIEETGIYYQTHINTITANAQRMQQIVEHSTEGVLITSLRGVIKYVNPAMVKIFRAKSAEDILGTISSEYWVERTLDDFMREVWPVLLAGEPWYEESEMWRVDGTSFLASFTSLLIRDADQRPRFVTVTLRDITEERAAIKQREQLQQQIIETQQRTLQELSVPLIRLSADALMLPLIGMLDQERIQTISETLLHGLQNAQARYVLIDITGVPQLTPEAAYGLNNMARAAQLLGSRVILTGIQPEVAQMLVSVASDVSAFETLASLETGIQRVLRTTA